MKRTQLEKLQAARTLTQTRTTVPPPRFAQGSGAVADRREQRRLDRERGLVPFAVKIDSGLAGRLRAKAAERGIGLNELVGELLRNGLDDGSSGAAK